MLCPTLFLRWVIGALYVNKIMDLRAAGFVEVLQAISCIGSVLIAMIGWIKLPAIILLKMKARNRRPLEGVRLRRVQHLSGSLLRSENRNPIILIQFKHFNHRFLAFQLMLPPSPAL
ncbi:hypothetical protein CHI06_03405 [Bacillus sp. 7884-1]|nr:hypothetical protein CHI06_03405 [Bacillus sp. 7884-1]